MPITWNSFLSSIGDKIDETITTGNSIINSILSTESSATVLTESKNRSQIRTRGQERGNAVKYKYNHVFEHKFQFIWLTKPTDCSQCKQLIYVTQGQACMLCGFISHKDCLQNIDFKCEKSNSSGCTNDNTLKSTDYQYKIIFGHKIKPKSLYQPYYCSQCNGLILGLFGQICELCNLASHRDCLHKIKTLCLESSTELQTTIGQQHEIIQRDFIIPTSCDHCGKTIFVSQGLECSICNLTFHINCKKYIYNRECNKKNNDKILLFQETNNCNKLLLLESEEVLNWNKISFEDFKALKLLGKGSMSKVLLVELKLNEEKIQNDINSNNNNNNLLTRSISISFNSKEDSKIRKFAMKIIDKKNIIVANDPESVKTEMNVLKLGRSFPFLPIFHCSFQSRERLFFIMEFIDGKDLFYHVFGKNEKIPESIAKFYAAEIYLALDYLHNNGILHRDLKLENVLLEKSGHCKLIDFGMSKELSQINLKAKTFCGTPRYISPEIIKEKLYDYSVDWWSFGILLFEMLLCDSPFINVDFIEENEIYDRILNYNPMEHFPNNFVSSEARDLIDRLLKKNPQDRIGCQLVEGCSKAIKEHQFFYFENNDNNNNSKQQQWDAILTKQFKVPYKPSNDELNIISDSNDSNNLKLDTIDSNEVNQISQKEFEGFSYYSESFSELLELKEDP